MKPLSNLLGADFRSDRSRQWDAQHPHQRRVRSPPSGRVHDSMLSEHQCQGWLEGLSAHRPARAVQQLRSFYPHRRFDVQPARQVAQGHKASCPGGRPISSLNYLLRFARLAAGPQRLHASGSGIHGPRRSTRRPTSFASTCRPTPTACCPSSTTACAAATTSTSWSPASTPCRNG